MHCMDRARAMELLGDVRYRTSDPNRQSHDPDLCRSPAGRTKGRYCARESAAFFTYSMWDFEISFSRRRLSLPPRPSGAAAIAAAAPPPQKGAATAAAGAAGHGYFISTLNI